MPAEEVLARLDVASNEARWAGQSLAMELSDVAAVACTVDTPEPLGHSLSEEVLVVIKASDWMEHVSV